MDVAVHLVSAPWSKPDNTSIQLGALHAFVDSVFADAVDVFSYSAFLEIPFRAAGGDLFPFFERVAATGEHAYMALFLERYWRELVPTKPFPMESVLRALGPQPLPRSVLRKLRLATEGYIDEKLAPQLKRNAVNLVGFSLNYDQVYASAYMARYIARRYAEYEPTFLFGGYSTSVPHVVSLLHRLNVPGCLVIGEGEKKLELIVRTLLSASPDPTLALDSIVSKAAPGVYEISANAQSFETRVEDYATQFTGLAELPVPNYDEYFANLEAMTNDAETFQLMVARSHIMVEGSRGCFAKCDFCGLNSTWRGFRKSTPEAILAQLVELASRYTATNFDFVDNVCDTWAEKFADLVAASRMRFRTLHELRAHHTEAFWTKLALAGAFEIQIGIEALSQPLLTHIGKGTKVVQNVAVQKYLTELRVWSYGNIITDHPRSTVADVAETRRILEQCPHLGVFGLATYGVAPGSPLYNTLSMEQRTALRPRINRKLPRAVHPFSLENFCEVPASLACDPETKRAWRSFRQWLDKFRASLDGRTVDLAVTRLGPDKLLVVDSRTERTRQHVLEGDESVVYDACHAGPKLRHLPGLVMLDEARTMAAVESLLRRTILLQIEDAVLAIALRPRDELIQNLYSRSRPAATIGTPANQAQAPLLQLRRAGSK